MLKRYSIILVFILISSSLGIYLYFRDDNSALHTFQVKPITDISKEHIHQLLQDQIDMGPRLPGSDSSLQFMSWLQEVIPQPWNIEIQAFIYLGVELRNYWITIPNSSPTYVIGAHYDSRAKATEDPVNSNLPVPGANDGASGVAGIIEMINHINNTIQSEIGFVLFDAEDQGSNGMAGWDWIVGSNYFVENMDQNLKNNMQAFVLFDMIADDDFKLPYEGRSTDYLVTQIWEVADLLGYSSVFINERGYSLIDDHEPFLQAGIPSIDIIDFDYPEWHTTLDDMDAVSADSIAIVIDVIINWLYNVISL
ncbi:MAG: M28 family peptidase [Candidatus Heimdallarchaeota archaeon]|nr:M28 family peptidase [Candidatus Heimdallarchaeota archaeon]MDH5645283.1 M28 family peptidase [Candidatus Heimdallarchaeota archaeon]